MNQQTSELANERTIPTNKRTNEAREETKVALSYRRGRLLGCKQTDATTPNIVGTYSASWEGYNP